MGRPHLLVIPYPAQGHVMPLMELSYNLVDRGFKITFVHTEDTHKKVVAALSSTENNYEEFIELVSIPDGLEANEEERKLLLFELIVIMIEKMPAYLEELINKINTSNDGNDRISCVIADVNCGWAVEVAKKLSIPQAIFLPASADLIATNLSIPKLIEDGIISEDGAIIKEQTFQQQSPTMPAKITKDLPWLNMGGIPAYEKIVYDMIRENNRAITVADYFLCNSFYDLEPSAFDLVPNLKPIGPIFASSKMAHFWAEDSTCLSWLDQQPPSSVIYVAFGSLAILDKKQFDELALGLELSGQRFLWVVRQDLVDNKGTVVYPDGFEERVSSRGRIVGWAPQREVLAHPSVGCFLSHCGWNSTIEGISRGVPFLCCPYFYDQILNKKYICDVWKTGLGFNEDENGLISREEIKSKVVLLFGDEEIKGNALKLKERARENVADSGVSSKNFNDFVQAIRCNIVS